ncbi:MAG TPA: hypothetical protein ENJ50_03310 [Planctomycetaceae bacterium]|nr:hypothetical protein [Planctomycetaceae bacterium]
MSGLPDYYAILGVLPRASTEEIRRAYLRLAQQHHPDVTGEAHEAAEIKKINDAFRVLSDPAARRQYDASRRKTASRQSPRPAAHSRQPRRSPHTYRSSRRRQVIDFPVRPEETRYGSPIQATIGIRLECPRCANRTTPDCLRCHGTGHYVHRQDVLLRLPRGCRSGQLIELPLSADLWQLAGDVFLRIRVQPCW